MAIYHLHVKNISRGEGRSILAAAAYRAGETLPNELEERMSVFGGRRDVVANEIRVPQGAPSWMADRAQLWNAVEAAEKRKDARLAKELEFSLPRELPRSAWLGVAHAMADAYAAKGFIADLAIHDDGAQHNPHVHLLLTTRVITVEGFGPKIRSADGRAFVIEARSLWARVANAALGKAGIAVAIDERSYAKRQLERKPGEHRGPDREERQARRARLQQRRPQMIPREPEEDLPVPDPDGNPIHPRELGEAESRMLDDMHAVDPGPGGSETDGIDAARAAVDRESAREMSDDEAAAYRLAPENLLDWLGSPASPHDVADVEVLERWENHLDWLDIDRPQPAAPTDEGISHEPERGGR
ncbi:MobA/MobL family protein [Rhizobium sp. CCGE 510]|uniref:MobA/MobL family protein n=1 Tax=Rhizobium sp. CCGE 510 TaxID=1132836 RepID=UPI00027B7B76|nr:MobA/MobL family protein [Rhizobium sp. CCGE 510]EJT04924.1 conjugal transfer protein [Rhizobium sp. CCGE 510]